MTPRRAVRALLCLSVLLVTLSASLVDVRNRHRAPAAPPAPPSSPVAQVAPALPAAPALCWERDYPPLTSAWPDQPSLQSDAVYRPVLSGSTLLVASSRTDSVTAIDAGTGAEKWRFVTDGPVRFVPAVWEDRTYFASDDGYLYCVAIEDGALIWKSRGGPSDRKLLGNGRLISAWPARGGPAVSDGTVYFAAGIWPFMGIFLHALDARTGEVVWTNDGDGSTWMDQPHGAAAFGAVAPQGSLVVSGDFLLVPGGRSVPACYARKTGKLLHYKLAENSKLGGGFDATAAGGYFLNGGALFEVETGKYLSAISEPALLTDDLLFSCTPTQCQVFDVAAATQQQTDSVSRRGSPFSWSSFSLPKRATVPLNGVTALARSEPHLLAGRPGEVVALEIPRKDGPPTIAWRVPVEGTPAHMVAAEGRLFVSTREGRLYAFGLGSNKPHHYPLTVEAPVTNEAAAAQVRDLLGTTGVRDGWCVVWGTGDGQFIHELARQSNLRIVVIEPRDERVQALRQRLIAADLYGERVAVLPGDWRAVQLPPYLASLMIAETLPPEEAFLPRAFAALRPYGGVACLPVPPEPRTTFARYVTGQAELPRALVRDAGSWVLLSREGALPGAADWTHEHADAGNSRVSRDALVKAPLGVLWFGGPSHQGMLPRHGHGPQPQVVEGRLIIEGVDVIRAVDVYTGRLLWETRLPGVGQAYDNTFHQPGANAGGGNYVSLPDGIYVAYKHSCLRLDPATGRSLNEFSQPPLEGETEAPAWSYVNACDDYLVGGGNPPEEERHDRAEASPASRRLVVLDRKSGKLLWSATAHVGFRHNSICIGGGWLFCMDRPSLDHLRSLRRRGETTDARPRLVAFDLRTGAEAWSSEDVFGTWLSYSPSMGVLVEAGRVARDTLYDEPTGIRAYCADNGTVLWHRADHAGPAMIRDAMVLTNRGACDLRTGASVLRADPLTGQMVEWTWTRGYGCNTPAASEHLLTFRSGAAGYFDLANDGGTGNFGGFRSGCTNNLIVAGGVLNAPDYTRTCTCSYQNQTSLALVPMPEAEMWTWFGRQDIKGPVRRVGINLGAPGNRKSADGTLWLEYPPVGGPSPRLPVTVEPAQPEFFRRHSSQVGGDGPAWVTASGAKGLHRLTVTLGGANDPERRCTVRLHFMEPGQKMEGERVFDVALQGQTVLRAFDVSREAGGPLRGVVREFRGVVVQKELTVTLTPADGAAPPVLSGVEIVAEE